LFNLDYKNHNEIYSKFINEKIPDINNRQVIFIEHYFNKYDEEYLPSWMLFEELTI
jgi:hypothetical protein